MARKLAVQTWQEAGTGDPALLWDIKYWASCLKDAKHLTPEQYWHVAEQLKELARYPEPAKCPTVDVAKVNQFWVLHDKGGILRKTNIRVFFVTEDSGTRKEIVVLGVHKKEEEGKLRRSVVERIDRRLRLYKECLVKPGDSL